MPSRNAGVNCCDALENFPELGGLVWVNGDTNVYLYTPSTNQWTTIASNLALGGTWHTASYNPVHKVLLFYSAGTNALYKLSSSGQVTRLQNPPVTIYDGSGYNGVLTVDPVSGKYLVLTASAHQLYTYDVMTDTWQQQSSPTKPDLSGQAVVAAPVSTYGVTFFASCAAATCNAYLYKYAVANNQPPVVNAGPDQTVTVLAGATLAGTVTDDGLPSGSLTVQWSMASGPAPVLFSSPQSATTNVTVLVPGVYVFRLTAFDGQFSATDDMTVVVNLL